jgi:hypothetical protein
LLESTRVLSWYKALIASWRVGYEVPEPAEREQFTYKLALNVRGTIDTRQSNKQSFAGDVEENKSISN